MSGGGEVAAPGADLVEEVLREAGIETCRDLAQRLALHAAEMLRWNQSIRLTAITDPLEVAVKHIADSLALLRFAPFPGRMLDFGSGAGYPGVPLAIYLPGTRVVLLESSAKKCAFLSHIRAQLRLENMVVVNARARTGEALSIGKFDDIVMRAVASPAEAVPLLSPYLAEGGRMLFMEGRGGREIPGSIVRRERFSLPRGMGEREIAEVVP